MKYLVFLLTLLYFLLGFVIPTYQVWKSTGINPITFAKEDNAHDYIGGVFKVLMGFLLLNVCFYAFWANGYQVLVPIVYVDQIVEVKYSGFALLAISLIWLVIAQIQMSNSWRIGIDEEHETELKTSGLFGKSRNPIFLGMLISLLGLFLITPNALMLTVFVCSVISIQVQVRLEEEFLAKQKGGAYAKYRQEVRRWI